MWAENSDEKFAIQLADKAFAQLGMIPKENIN
jgi:hypothetical protein